MVATPSRAATPRMESAASPSASAISIAGAHHSGARQLALRIERRAAAGGGGCDDRDRGIRRGRWLARGDDAADARQGAYQALPLEDRQGARGGRQGDARLAGQLASGGQAAAGGQGAAADALAELVGDALGRRHLY